MLSPVVSALLAFVATLFRSRESLRLQGVSCGTLPLTLYPIPCDRPGCGGDNYRPHRAFPGHPP
jgi:hypothetical protein